MNIDKKIIYAMSGGIFAVLALALFLSVESSRILAACLLLPIAIVACIVIRKRSIPSINKKEVLLLITVIGLLYVMALYLSGLHFGFYRSAYPLSLSSCIKVILPITVIIITAEIIRNILLAQNSRVVDVLAYLSCVASEVLIHSTFKDITGINTFMNVVGMALFPAITANALYHYLSKCYGIVPNIVFRLITTLYPYVISIVPATPDSLESLAKLLIPLVILLFIRMLYEKKKRYARQRTGKLFFVGVCASVALMISLVMLISCQFKFGVLVIATESMSDEINKGDAIVFEQYEDQTIEVGDVIIFERGKSRIVHRVTEIQKVAGQNRYFTKGDANESADIGFITDEDIVGVTCFKIAYVGYPSLWVRDIVSN